ncbi:MAG: GIY-YIG nuclease family protein [Acidobacteria bacterium]|nr:GIY-YIG nuclease family protein [Acidobacteriota bacterium]MBI3662284.1 GIY-YIG nuclease family protein [Acidobacteriota bacterium]
MPYFLYALRSAKSKQYYIGSTENLDTRFAQHKGILENPSRWTRGRGPWELIFSRLYATRAQAVKAERFLKRMKSRRFIERLLRGERNLDSFDNSEKSP